MEQFQFSKFPMQLHRKSVSCLSGDERHFFEREILHVSHAHHLLVYRGETLNQEKRRLSIQDVEKTLGMASTRFKTLFDKDIERACFGFPVLVNNQVIEDVVEKRFHCFNLPAFHKITPCFCERFLHQVVAHRVVVHLEECMRIKPFFVVIVRFG